MTDLVKADRSRGRQLIVAALTDSPSTSTADLAARVLASVDTLDDALDMLAAALPDYIRANTHAMTGRSNTLASPHIRPRSINPPKAKDAAKRYMRLLAIRETVADGTQKWLKDLTADDLRFAAEKRRNMAHANELAAKKYDVLADALDELGAATVADVPGDRLVEVLA